MNLKLKVNILLISKLMTVYIFDETTEKWIDKGTGFVAVKYIDKFNSLGIQVTDEASINTLFGIILYFFLLFFRN